MDAVSTRLSACSEVSPSPLPWTSRPWHPERVRDDAASVAAGEVLVLFAEVDRPVARQALDLALFSTEEVERARRFRLDRDRHEFLLARTIVRTLFSALLELSPAEVPFAAEPHCKPRLAPEAGWPVDVSITHSGGWVACGFALGRQIGIDIEQDRRPSGPDIDAIARSVFSAQEGSVYAALSDARRRAFFFDLWRRKEAVLKAAGVGLSVCPSTVQVIAPDGGLAPRVCARVHACGGYWALSAGCLQDGPDLAVALSETLPV